MGYISSPINPTEGITMPTAHGSTLAATIEANKRHLEWFFEEARAPVEFLAREIARVGYRIYSVKLRAGECSLRLSLIMRQNVVSVVN